MSLSDTITDFVCNYHPWQGGFVHEGILKGAIHIHQELQPSLEKWTKQFDTKSIVCLGHSMGGSISAILSRIIIDSNDSFNVNAYTFGAPPIVSSSLSPLFTHVISVVNHNDLVTRLSYGAMVRLKDHIKVIDEHKNDNMDQLYEELKKPVDPRFPQMLIPGRVFWMHKYSQVSTMKRIYNSDPLKKPKAHMLMQEVDPRHLLEIQFGSGMLHHMPNYYEKSYLRCYQYLQEIQ